MKKAYTIPDDFFIGTSSSAWQIEGCAGKDKDQKSWAELFYDSAPEKWHNGIGPYKASDFYHHYEDDIKTMASFNMRAFRFTIQWARFMKDPLQGIVDERAATYYQNVIDSIISNGMEPIISLEHWDIPAVLFEKYGGWTGRECVDLYEIYVKEVLKRYAGSVKKFFAFTEPNIPIDNGYMDKIWYPFAHDPKAAYQAHFHKILATAKAVKAIQPYRPQGCTMGAMVHMTPVYARSGEIQDVMAAYYADLFHVRLYLDPYLKGEIPRELILELKKHACMFAYEESDLQEIREHKIDILGVDYYFPIRVKARETPYEGEFHPLYYYEPWIKPDRKFNQDRGWEVYEQAIYDIGMRIKNQYGNIDWFISENGIGIEGEEKYRNKNGYIDDDYRIDFLKEHLRYTLKAREDGCNCHGYLVWSFIDNVSAINSFKNRYGLMELNLDTYDRIPKKSLYWFKDILSKKCLKEEYECVG
ncbi:glycoside hydrolase family 1 protein [[Clostridium] innocuum]|nr:glycoside hydrolase family 1 protein [[Clostridium] innocuum]MCR0443855.1 glycoside hydrolase family 1 protein [[Clostridium] innocuum]